MKRLLVLTMALGSLLHAVQETASVTLSGTVKDNAGVALEGVTVTLAGIENLSAETGADGAFTLTNVTGVLLSVNGKTSLGYTILKNTIVFTRISDMVSGTVSLFSSDGRQIVSVCLNNLHPGKHQMDLPELSFGFYVLAGTVNGESFSQPLVLMGNSLYPKNKMMRAVGKRTLTLRKSAAAAAADTLIVAKDGYDTARLPITSYSMEDIEIILAQEGCTREFLDGIVDDYFAALAAGDPSSLPLAPKVKFTENAEASELGTAGLWQNAGALKYSQRALDTEQCAVAAHAVVPEGTTDRPIALRIKVEDKAISEIETIVVRPGDYTASFAVASNPAAIISIANQIGWDDEVPEAERATRQELIAWMDKYFRAFPSGVCNTTGDCKRIENGGGNFACSTGAGTCSSNPPGSGGTLIPRIILADEVRGIAVGITIFEFGGSNGHLDMHMIKMHGGQVHAVQAILRDTDGQYGWD